MTDKPRPEQFPHTVARGANEGNVDIRQEYADLQMMGFNPYQAMRVLVEDARRLGFRVRAGNAAALARFDQTAQLLAETIRALGKPTFNTPADTVLSNNINHLYDLCKGTHLERAMVNELVRINRPGLYGTAGAWKISFTAEHRDAFASAHEQYWQLARESVAGTARTPIKIADFLQAASDTPYAARLRESALEAMTAAIARADPNAVSRAWFTLQKSDDADLTERATAQLAAFIEQAKYDPPYAKSKRSSRNLEYKMGWQQLLSPAFSAREQNTTDPRIVRAAQSFIDRNRDALDPQFIDRASLSPVFGLWSLPVDRLGPAMENALDSFDALETGADKEKDAKRAAIARSVLSVSSFVKHGPAHPRLMNLSRFLMQDAESQSITGDTLQILLQFYAGSPHYEVIYGLAASHLGQGQGQEDFMRLHFAEELAGCLFETAAGSELESDAYNHLLAAVIKSEAQRGERQMNDVDAEIALLSRYLNINEHFDRRRHADPRPEAVSAFARNRLRTLRDSMAKLAPSSAITANSVLIADAMDTPAQQETIRDAHRFIAGLPVCVPGKPVIDSPLARELNICRSQAYLMALRACKDSPAAQLFFDGFVAEHDVTFEHTHFTHKHDVMDTENPAQVMIGSAFYHLPDTWHSRLTAMAERHVEEYLQAGQRLSATKLMDRLYKSVQPNPTRPWIVYNDEGDVRAVSVGWFHDGRNKKAPTYGPITVLPGHNLTTVVNDHTPVMLRWMFLRGRTRQASKEAGSSPVHRMAAAFVAAACHNPPDAAHWNAYVAEARRTGAFRIGMAD